MTREVQHGGAAFPKLLGKEIIRHNLSRISDLKFRQIGFKSLPGGW
jgi:hypothetical protein